MSANTYRFDYTSRVDGRSRSAIKTIKSYHWARALQLLVGHVSRKWVNQPVITLNNAEMNGALMNPDLFPEMQRTIDTFSK